MIDPTLYDFYGLAEDGTPPPLDPELEAYIFDDSSLGPSIKHPLVYSIMHVPMLNGRVNQQLALKKTAVQQAHDAGDWGDYLALHERPHRIMAFVRVSIGMDDEEYWGHLAYLWTDTENLYQNAMIWRALLENPKRRGRRRFFMNEDDRAALTAMRSPIKIYRGTSAPDGMGCGLAWTTDKERAEWFAQRFADLRDGAVVISGTVMKSKVIAYFTTRRENEIVTLPEHVTIIAKEVK